MSRVKITVVFAALLALAMPAGTSAAKPRAKLGNVKTASQTVTFGGENSTNGAVATCPGKTLAVSGGFTTTTPSSAADPIIFPYESRRIGARRWRVSGTNNSPGAGGALTSFAYCRRLPRGVKPKAVRSGALVPRPPATGTATATCPKGRKVVSGGFLVPPLGGATAPAVIAPESRRTGGRSWSVTAVDLAFKGTATVNSYAYCLPVRSPRVAFGIGAAPPPDPTIPHGTGTTAPCRKALAAGGGYSSPFVFGPPDSAVMIYESLRSTARTWTASGIEVGGAGGTGTIVVSALCS